MHPEVYYHIFANPAGAAIAKEQIEKITRFIPQARIHCGVIAADRDAASDLMNHLESISTVEVFVQAAAGNEWVTLAKLHEDCRERWPARQPVLYAHTKGAYSASRQPGIVPAWREWMEYFNFFRYEDALRALEKGYSVYGFDLWLNPRRPLLRRLGFRPRFFIFSGNYWWSTAGAIRRIPLTGIDREVRHSAETQFVARIPRLRPFDALQLIGLPSIPGGAYTNYNDDFLHFPELQEKAGVMEEMRATLRRVS